MLMKLDGVLDYSEYKNYELRINKKISRTIRRVH